MYSSVKLLRDLIDFLYKTDYWINHQQNEVVNTNPIQGRTEKWFVAFEHGLTKNKKYDFGKKQNKHILFL